MLKLSLFLITLQMKLILIQLKSFKMLKFSGLSTLALPIKAY